MKFFKTPATLSYFHLASNFNERANHPLGVAASRLTLRGSLGSRFVDEESSRNGTAASDVIGEIGILFDSRRVLPCSKKDSFTTSPDPDTARNTRRRSFLLFSGNAILSFTSFEKTAKPVNAYLPEESIDATDILKTGYQVYRGVSDPQLRAYTCSHLPKWQGTSLQGPLSTSDAFQMLDDSYQSLLPMGKWPDPVLRHSSSPIPPSTFHDPKQLAMLRSIARALRNTARNEGAVGLAAQQCGIDASLIFIDNITVENGKLSNFQNGNFVTRHTQANKIVGEGRLESLPGEQGIFLVNPRIVKRSPEKEMLVWTEECLVLPPEFRATLLRDAEVVIEYETLDLSSSHIINNDITTETSGKTKQIHLAGELARCAQHEMDHDRGILILDHVALNELLTVDGVDFMAKIENSDGLHDERMRRAYSRTQSPSSVDYDIKGNEKHLFIPSASAASEDIGSTSPPTEQSHTQYPSNPSSPTFECDAECLEERRRIISQRRAMMNQSKSNTKRADLLELSKQRSKIYETNFRGLEPNICAEVAGGLCP